MIENLKPNDLNCNIFSAYDYPGMTIQELLSQFFTKINECVKQSNDTFDIAEWLLNEGLSIEVVKKLTIWLNDGTLENLINVSLFEGLNTKLEDVTLQMETIVNGINVELAWGIMQGVDQTKELQSKIDVLKDNSVLIFSGDNYIIKELVINNKRNIKIVGYNSRLFNDDSFKNTFKITNSENITIEGFNVDCNWSSFQDYTKGQFIYCENSKDVRIFNNIIKRGGLSFLKCENINVNGNKLTDTEQLNSYPILLRNVEGAIIVNNRVEGARVDGIKVSMEMNGVNNSKSIIITNNIISNCFFDGIDLFAGGYRTIVSNNTVTECEKGVHVKAWGGDESDYSSIEGYAKNILIQGNQLFNNRHQNVWVGCDNVIVSNNILTDSPYGVYIMSAKIGKVKNILISNNIMKEIGTNAICTESETEEIIINDNFIENVTNYALMLRSYNVTIENNTLIDVGSRGISISSSYGNNRIIITNTKIVNKNKTQTIQGIVINGSIRDNSLISNCVCEGIQTPLSSPKIKENCNSWTDEREYKTELIQITKDLQISETQTINTALTGTIKKITTFGVVQSTKKTFNGVYVGGENQCVYTMNDSGNYTNTSQAIAFAEDLSDRTFGKILNITPSGFDIVWTKTGVGANGTAAKINIVIEYY